MKIFTIIFGALAVALSDVMCAVVAYNYCDMLWGIRYSGYSAPAATALLIAPPYLIAIAACTCLAVLFYKKSKA